VQYTVQGVLGQAWQQFRDQTFTVLPHLIAGLFIFVVGLALGMVVSRAARWVLKRSRFDSRASELGLTGPLQAVGISSAVRLVATALQVVILLVASILALYSLDARLASDLAERFFLYLPHLIVAFVILTAGMLVAKFLARSVLISAVNSEIRAAALLAGFTRVAVMIVAGAMAFEHLGISRETVLIAFAILFGGATLATSIAMGLAMQDVARRWVADQILPAPREQQTQIEHW
jgi:hypothetical protein